LTAATLALFAVLSQADAPRPFALNPYLEATLLAGDALLLGGGFIAQDTVRFEPCPCSEQGIWGIDRVALGLSSSSAGTASDVIQDFMIVAAPVGVFVAGLDDGLGGGATLAAIELESLALSASATFLVKNVVVRPRPYTYPTNDTARSAYQSFWSGHTAIAFTASTSTFVILQAQFPHEAWPYAVGASAEALAVAVGILRVSAGQHFPTDVIAGAAAGTLFGWLVPFLHRQPGPIFVAPQPGGLAVAFRY
jgi:membrane-associated phospholipid phosphatase